MSPTTALSYVMWEKHLPTPELDFLICKMEVIVSYFISDEKHQESNFLLAFSLDSSQIKRPISFRSKAGRVKGLKGAPLLYKFLIQPG